MKDCRIPYINSIRRNVLSVDSEELRDLYEDLRRYDVIVGVGSGRAKHAMNIPLSQAATMKKPKTIISLEGPSFPWGSIYEAAPILEKRYGGRILFLFNSGSGETEDPCSVARDLEKYIEETKTEKLTVDAITSNPNSTIGRVAGKYGHVVRLKGKEAIPRGDMYAETGVMRDLFELGSCLLLQMCVDALYRDLESEMIYELAEEEFQTISEIINRSIDSEFYREAVNILETRCHVFRNSKGIGDEVVRATLIRLAHVKQAVGDEVYITNPPRPRAGDFQLSVSYSGATSSVINSSRIFRELGGYQFSVIGSKGTELEKYSTQSLILEEEVKPGQPRRFYTRALFVLSPLIIKLIERYQERGITLTEPILSYYHSVTE